MSGIDTERRLRGQDESQIEQDLEEYLASSLELVSIKACRGLTPTKFVKSGMGELGPRQPGRLALCYRHPEIGGPLQALQKHPSSS